MSTENQSGVTPENIAPQTQPTQEAVAEKLLPQSHVNSLVGAAKDRGYEKGYQDALTKAQQNTQPPQATMNTAGMTHEQIDRAISNKFNDLQKQQAEHQYKAAQEAEGTRILNELKVKVNDAKNRIPDFDNVTNQVNFRDVPEILHYANTVDNAGDVLYELAKNPGKIGIIRALTPDLAKMEVKNLSNSIKQNQSALSQPVPPEPLDSGKPSNVGSGKGPKSASEWRTYYKGRTNLK